MGFISSPIFLLFFIFYGCISFLRELIPFSRALDVVCLLFMYLNIDLLSILYLKHISIKYPILFFITC